MKIIYQNVYDTRKYIFEFLSLSICIYIYIYIYFLKPFSLYCFITFSFSYSFLTDSLFLVFPISSYVVFMCLPTTVGKIVYVCPQNQMNASHRSRFVDERPPQMSAPLE